MKIIAGVVAFAVIGTGLLIGQTVDKPLSIGGDVKPPVLIKQVDPDYRRPLFGKPKEGTVLVNLVIDPAGYLRT